MNPDATMNENAGIYKGLTREECRKQLVNDLKEKDLIVKIEKMIHSVGHSERTDAVVEPYLSKQWFVKMRGLADKVLENQKNKDTKVNFVPPRYEKTMNHWMEITYDWCISRQLWWGHRIPAWYKDDQIYVGEDAPLEEGWVQDNDVLDTWFSSALWPFATLGWPNETEDYKRYYPNNVLVTGYDIIPFWVNRMTFQGLKFTNKRPFKDCLIHGLIRDKEGRKMSKSLGNGIDPLEVIDKYGADALRFTLVTNNAPGNDMRFYWERVEASRNFANKVWNASRFIMMHLGDNVITEPAKEDLEVIDRWILSAANHVAADVTENMEKYELGVAVQKIYDFVWTEFCDWYIELVKPRLFAKDENPASANAAFWTLKTVLIQSLKLLHPYMPFITEEIFCTLQSEEESIMISNWPVYRKEWEDEQSEAKAELMKNLIRGIRNIRTEMNVAPSRKAVVYLVADDEATGAALEELIPAYQHMISASEVHVQADKTGIEDNAVSVVIDKATAYMPLADLVDFAKEKERLTKEKKKLEGELKRVNGMLGNEKFMSKAPEAKVAEERAKLEKYTAMMAKVEEELKALEK